MGAEPSGAVRDEMVDSSVDRIVKGEDWGRY